MNVVGCQFDIAWEDKTENFRRVREQLRSGDIAANTLIVLPEMFATGFSMNVVEIAEEPGGETEIFLKELARELRCFVVGGLVLKGADGKGRNECLVIGPAGQEITRYCKMHPFRFGGETEWYVPGEAIRMFEQDGFTVAPFICYDLRFPELFRHAVKCGANLFLVIANWPRPREEHWITLLRARAIENQAYVVGVNRCGSDPQTSYSGASMIVGPRGEVIARAENTSVLLCAELNLEALADYRRQFPALDDIRRDLFVHTA